MIHTPPKLTRPPHLPDEYWNAIAAEDERLRNAVRSGDMSDMVGSVKCLCESVAQVTMDLAGSPSPLDKYKTTISAAHNVLKRQRGRDLTSDPAVGRLADAAKRMAEEIGGLRNTMGTGHGRPRLPEVTQEATNLSLDGGLMWVQWALQRLDWYCYGRPTQLVEDLARCTFSKGELGERLTAANIEDLDNEAQRALGVAVGRRAATGTVVVRWDGIDEPIENGTLSPWTTDYRLGAATGLLRSPQGRWSLQDDWLKLALSLLTPIPDITDWLADLVEPSKLDRPLMASGEATTALLRTLDALAASRPEPERADWCVLRSNIEVIE